MKPEELVDVLTEVAEFLDNYADVDDGLDGPTPNQEMSLLVRVREVLEKIEVQR